MAAMFEQRMNAPSDKESSRRGKPKPVKETPGERLSSRKSAHSEKKSERSAKQKSVRSAKQKSTYKSEQMDVKDDPVEDSMVDEEE